MSIAIQLDSERISDRTDPVEEYAFLGSRSRPAMLLGVVLLCDLNNNIAEGQRHHDRESLRFAEDKCKVKPGGIDNRPKLLYCARIHRGGDAVEN